MVQLNCCGVGPDPLPSACPCLPLRQSKAGCTIYFPVLKAGFWQSGLGGLSEERWLGSLPLSRDHAAVKGSAPLGVLQRGFLPWLWGSWRKHLGSQGTADVFSKCRREQWSPSVGALVPD